MKKFKILMCIMICAAIMFNASSVLATNNEMVNDSEIKKQETIDELFTKLNNLALEKKQTNTLGEQQISSSSIEKNEKILEEQLEELGVHKFNPDNTTDVESFAEIVRTSTDSRIPRYDFSILVNAYSIYEYTGTYTINGKAYEYKYVRVVDNKGYGGLTAGQLITFVGQVNTTVGNLLSYNFSYGFSAFLGLIPGGGVVDWALGNVFTALNSYNSSTSVVFSSNSSIYCANVVSVTEMTYYYIRVNGVLQTAGSRASNMSFARTDSFSANVGGKAVAYPTYQSSFNSSSGNPWYWYLEQFAKTASATHHTLGSIKLYGNGISVTFTPKYFSNPAGLI